MLSPLFPPVVVSVLSELTTEETDRQPVCYALGGEKIFFMGRERRIGWEEESVDSNRATSAAAF